VFERSQQQTRTGRLLLVCLALAAPALAGPAVRGDAAVVLQQVRGEADAKRAIEVLSGYGQELLGEALVILTDGELDVAEGERSGLTRLQREALLGAVARLSSPWVMQELERRYRPELDLDARRAFLAIMEYSASAWDLEFLIELGTPGPEAPFTHQQLAERFVLTLKGALGRREVGAEAGNLIVDAPDAVRRSLVTGLGSIRTTRSLELLGQLMGADAALDKLVLKQIWLTTRSGVGTSDRWLIEALGEQLTSLDPDCLLFAAQSLGYLGVSDSVPRLIELLDHDAARVSVAVLSTLRDLSGQALPADSGRWRVWLSAESEWATRNLSSLPADLSHESAGLAAQRINEYSRHTHYREPLGPVIASAAGHPEPQIRRLAAIGLKQLGAASQAFALVPLLEDESAEVRRESLASLRALTNLDLLPDPRLWDDALNSFGSP